MLFFFFLLVDNLQTERDIICLLHRPKAHWWGRSGQLAHGNGKAGGRVMALSQFGSPVGGHCQDSSIRLLWEEAPCWLFSLVLCCLPQHLPGHIHSGHRRPGHPWGLWCCLPMDNWEPKAFFFFFLVLGVFLNFYWHIVALQWCFSICYTAKWIRHTSPLFWTSFPSRSLQSSE